MTDGSDSTPNGGTKQVDHSDMDMDMITQVLLSSSEIPSTVGDEKKERDDGKNDDTDEIGGIPHEIATKLDKLEIVDDGDGDGDESNVTLDGDVVDTGNVARSNGSNGTSQNSRQTLLDNPLDIKNQQMPQPVKKKASIVITRAMDSNDAKIIQYQYAILKSKMILANIKLMQTNFNLNSIPLINYMILYTRSIFAIQEKEFATRLDKLSQFQLFNSSTAINIPSIVTHIPYDINDLIIIPLDDLPAVEKARKCLTLLEGLLKTAITGYQKRLAAATNDDILIDSISSLIKTVVSNQDFDLSLTEMTFTLPPIEYRKDDDVIEASLIDMDISAMFTIIKHTKTILNTIKPLIAKYKLINDFKKIPTYALHEIFILSIRLNDLYTIFRSFGRKVYLSNLTHLHDQKFLVQAKNGSYLKMSLTKLEDLFNTNKKNGTLIATLTRFVRQNSQFEINSKNVKDFINFVNQGNNVISTSLVITEDFMINWTLAELKFRKFYDLPRKSLLAIYTKFSPPPQTPVKPPPVITVKNPKALPPISTTRRRKTSNAGIISPASSISSYESFPSVNKVPEIIINQSDTPNRDSRSSSVSSVNSNNSIRSLPQVSPQRPSSVFLNANANNSLSKLDTSPKVATRRRSNSQPVTGSINAASAGAAAALSKGLRSPMGSMKRKSPIKGPTSSLTSPTRASPPLANKNVNQQLRAVAEEEDKVISPTKLTANQRLQQHLRQASKSGSLMTQQKEVFTSVTFDPSNPSATNFKRPEKAVPVPVSVPTPSTNHMTTAISQPPRVAEPNPDLPPSVTRPTMFGKPTKRDTVTRQNTRRNSKSTAQMSDSDLVATDTSSSSNSSVNGSIKRVRFTGVPEYNEVEDMPTNYANQILKNFPSARTPSYRNHQAVKKKDSMFKKEESIVWRNELHKT